VPLGSSDTEKGLLRKIAEGDEAAFNILVDRYAGIIYAVALGYIKIAESAEDIAQEVFYKIWKGRDLLDQVDSL
jgi:RNA polymerase sigma-70 factor (ECF subfamily)